MYSFVNIFRKHMGVKIQRTWDEKKR